MPRTNDREWAKSLEDGADVKPAGDGMSTAEVTHRCPPLGASCMPCCGRTPFEVPSNHRMTEDKRRVTCKGATPGADFSFCESVHAGSQSRWHIRKLTGEGRKLGGGIDTPSLCAHVRVGFGWDLGVAITEHHLTHSCRDCVTAYAAATPRAKP